MANIHDISKRAGVSVTTVSRVLNNHPYVSASKRELVQRIIDEMDYTPNHTAIDLIRKETRCIGVIIPYNNNQAFDQLLHGILSKSVELNYSVMVLPTNYDPEREFNYLNMLKNKKIDSVIIASRTNSWESIISYSKYGTIVACEYSKHLEIGCAFVDRYQSYLDAFQLLKNKGHVSVAFTTARGEESNSTQLTVKAYQKIFGHIPHDYHVNNCSTIEDGYCAAKQLLQLKNRPTAIYSNGDEVAAGILQYAKEIQLIIPNDLAIFGQENQPVGIGLNLSTVDHRFQQIGEQAFELAIRKSKDKIKIPYQIIERQST